MDGLLIFSNAEFGQIRTVEVEGKIYFVASDVAKALGYEKPANAVAMHCRYTLKQGIPHPQNPDKRIEVNVIPEGDMYRLITHSKLESAERFESWVFDEVLPALRKTGSYEMPRKLSAIEQIQLNAQAILEVHEAVRIVNEDLQQFKRNLPLLPAEAELVTNTINKVAVSLLGGKDSNAYKNSSLRGKLYCDIHRELKRQFGVTKYKYIKSCQCETAISIIEAYKPPMIMAEQISDCNAQINIGQDVA